jgi:hypothetical protein
MTYKLFLDDVRAPLDSSWVVARTSQAANEYLLVYGLPMEMSLDHDLGELSVGDVPVYLDTIINRFLDGVYSSSDILNIKLSVHSANPVGRTNLEGKWASFTAFIRKNDHICT